jgi:Nucleotidyltransferase of unknown function (DUF6036)
MTDIATSDRARELLAALSEQLAARGQRYELVVVGGSGLLALGFPDRPTGDVDVVALWEAGSLRTAKPLPQSSSMPATELHATLACQSTGSIQGRQI